MKNKVPQPPPYYTVPMSLQKSSYTTEPKPVVQMQISGFDPTIHDAPGVYLQRVDGAGYDVYELAPDEAIRIGKALVKHGRYQQTVRQKYEQK